MMRRLPVLLTALSALTLSACESQDKVPTGDELVRNPPRVVPAEPRDGLIPVNRPAPDFDAVDHRGRRIMLSEMLKAKQVVLIFYPADFTPGCTRQLCAVRDQWGEFQRRNAIVIGVNPALPSQHARFAEEYNLPFPIICDVNGTIAQAYGARGNRDGHPARTVYVIRRDGAVAFAEYGMASHEHIFAALDRP